MAVAVLLTLLFACLIAAVVAWAAGRRLRREAGLPLHARVVYADTGAWERVEKPLFSRRYLLTGKPDYIVADGGEQIPVEVKPNRGADAPRVGDTLQLAAYGLLIEENNGVRASHGLLKYRNAVFQVEFTEELRAELLEVLGEMRQDLSASDVARSHEDPRRCRACGYRHACGQQLDV